MSRALARVVAMTVGMVVASAATTAAAGELRGRVHETGGAGPGIPSLTVKLTPAAGRGSAVKTTLTDADGGFDLGDVAPGDYTLEILQRTTSVYRSTVHVGDTAVSKDVELKRE